MTIHLTFAYPQYWGDLAKKELFYVKSTQYWGDFA